MKTRLLCIETTTISPIQSPPPPVPATGANLYNGTQGAILDVAADASSVDVQTLLSSGYFVLLGAVGTTSQRPTYPKSGEQFIDSTLSKLITYDGAAWRDVTGTSV